MTRTRTGTAIMAFAAGYLLALWISGSPGLWMVIAGLLTLLAGSMVLTDGWIPQVQSRRRYYRRLNRLQSPLTGPGTARRRVRRDASLGARWLP